MLLDLSFWIADYFLKTKVIYKLNIEVFKGIFTSDRDFKCMSFSFLLLIFYSLLFSIIYFYLLKKVNFYFRQNLFLLLRSQL